MKVGIISRRIRKSRRKLFKKPEIYKLTEEVFSAEIPYSAEEIAKFSERKYEKVLNRAENMLKNQGAERIVLTKELKREPFDVAEVFFRIAPKAVRLAAKKFEISTPMTICVRQKNPDYSSFSVIKSLIFDVKSIGILTDKPHKGGKIRDKIMQEFGAVTEILPYDYVCSDGIMVNLDKSEISIFGKWILKDFRVDIETFGYDADSLEFFSACGGDYEKVMIKDCRCGKNKLTLL